MTAYAELHCISNFSFLRGASTPEELVQQAVELGYQAIAITDECSLAGVVKAYKQKQTLEALGYDIKLIIGSEFHLQNNFTLVALAPDKIAYESLSAYITLCRRRAEKGQYKILIDDIALHLNQCLLIYSQTQTPLSTRSAKSNKKNKQSTLSESMYEKQLIEQLSQQPNVWIGYSRLLHQDDEKRYQQAFQLASTLNKPMVACGNVHMHVVQRKMLQDTLTAIHHNTSIQKLGSKRLSNSENYLRPIEKIERLYPEALIRESLNIADRCHFSLDELRYQYPKELVPKDYTASVYLRQLVYDGAHQRWPHGIAKEIKTQIEKELSLIEDLRYEYYFLTVHDIVSYARTEKILCQGRGSAANSIVCYCLFITEVDPSKISLLFERFISKERNEPPDIDVDFEHERREEVIQYIYKKYSRERAALAATVITYRSRSAIRDVGKALGLNNDIVEKLSRSLGWWHKPEELEQRFIEAGFDIKKPAELNQLSQTHDGKISLARWFMRLVREIMGFPRHLSQHVGGFIISDGPISRLVPVENASMPNRTVIQWDKEDIETLGLLKVDVLALGMLSAIRKMLDYTDQYLPPVNDRPALSLSTIPREDTRTYDMLCRGDSLGIFQVESRAQMSMLPRLKPRQFYDLVIQVAIVRPGPIQGDMVHPFLRRRDKVEPVSYENEAVKKVLSRTLGVPIFQEQVIKLAMVAAGFSGGEADELRRAMASWGKNGNLLQFEEKLLKGMQDRGYSEAFSKRLFEQMKGFGSYGFPESHAASFALLVYISSWLKCHHASAFYTGIINSQPMGFYSPSQLIQDAKRQDIQVLPIDVTKSNWDCHLENIENIKRNKQPDIRLGMRLLKGFSQESAERIINARQQSPFNNLSDLIHRTALNQHERNALIRGDATASISGNRHQSHWQNFAVDPSSLMNSSMTHSVNKHTNTEDHSNNDFLNDQVILAKPTEIEDIRADYSYTGLTLKKHPMLLLREIVPFNRCKRYSDLSQLNHKRFVTVAGIVTGKQRPGTASGVIFVTLEDETGNINVVVWKNRQIQYREILLKSKLLMVKGILERKNEVTHIIAGQLIDCSKHLENYILPSRNFR